MSGENPFPWFVQWSGENPFPWLGRSKVCRLGVVKQARAFQLLGHLLVVVEGEKPNPCYEVKIVRSPIDIHPPEFLVQFCIDVGKVCPQVVRPYQAANLFASTGLKEITVATADGKLKVPVRKLGIRNEQALIDAAGGGVPSPFAPFSAPVRFGKIDEGEVEALANAKPREATGYSDSFSFDEAFRDAVQNLPPLDESYPDQLTTVTVTSVGALFGGIAGINKMFVSVRAV